VPRRAPPTTATDSSSRVEATQDAGDLSFRPLLEPAVVPLWVAVSGVLFVLGRLIYWKGYVEQPAKRLTGKRAAIAMQLTTLYGVEIMRSRSTRTSELSWAKGQPWIARLS
jgi:hypothetical protein